MDLLTYLSFFIFGYWVASKIIAFQMQFMIRRLAKEHNIDISDLDEETEVKPVAIPILITESVDKHGILLYDGKNNFMCQGTSLEEVAENLLKYKNIKVAIILHKDNKVLFVDGKVKKSQ